MLLSENHIALQQAYPLRVELSSENHHPRHIFLTAKSVWGKDDKINPGMFTTGFEFIDRDDQEVERIQGLIQRLGLREVEEIRAEAD